MILTTIVAVILQALVSHVSKLPDDVITPVVPPPLPSSSFELPRMQRRQHKDSLENQSTPQHQVRTFEFQFYSHLTCECCFIDSGIEW